MARKTLVTFPQRGKISSLEGEPVFSSKRGLSKKLAEEDSSTSSSSDSDSSSDSEEEDDSFKESRKTQEYFPRQGHISSEDQTTKINVVSKKGFLREQIKKSEKLSYSPRIPETSIKQKQLHEATGDDKLLKPDLTKHATDQNLKERHLESSAFGTKIIKSQRPRKVAHKQLEVSILEAASSTLSRTQTMPQQNVVQNLTLLKKEGVVAKEVQKSEELQEPVLNDRMPVVDPTVNEEMVLDEGDQSEQSTMQGIALSSALVLWGLRALHKQIACILTILII